MIFVCTESINIQYSYTLNIRLLVYSSYTVWSTNCTKNIIFTSQLYTIPVFREYKEKIHSIMIFIKEI